MPNIGLLAFGSSRAGGDQCLELGVTGSLVTKVSTPFCIGRFAF